MPNTTDMMIDEGHKAAIKAFIPSYYIWMDEDMECPNCHAVGQTWGEIEPSEDETIAGYFACRSCGNEWSRI